jgi:3-methyladenine DNA glycosylase Tag
VKAFAPVLERALARAGGPQALAEMLPTAKSARALRALGDDRYLSQMSLRIFRAGLRHAMVDDRWPAFEAVFKGFEPRQVVAFADEDVEAPLGA